MLLECGARLNLELRKHVSLAASTVLLDDVHRAGQHVGGGMKSDRYVEDGGGRGCAVLQALARGQGSKESAIASFDDAVGGVGGPAKLTFSSFAKPLPIQSKPHMN